MYRTALPTLALLAAPALAQDDCRFPDLTAFDAAGIDWFGASIAVDGTTAVVGTPFDDDLGADSGSAYVFTFGGGAWSLQAKLTATDGEAGDFFGRSVAIAGDRILVGAPFEDQVATDAGAVYPFQRIGTTWGQLAKVLASDGAVDDRFGGAVAMEATRAVIGAETHDGAASDGGAAYVFDWGGALWIQTTKLVASPPAADDYLGSSVALSGDRIVVGANGNDAAGTGAGSALVFDLVGSSWTLAQTLTADDPRVQGRFGDAVDVEGDTLVVTAPLDDDGVFNSGSVYVFDLVAGTWMRVAKLRAPAPAAGDEFGRSVALVGDTVHVGAPYQDDFASNGGGVYQFTRDTGAWLLASKLLSTSVGTSDQIGRSLAASSRFVLAGAPVANAPDIDSGRVHAYANPGYRREYGTGLAGTNGVPQVNGFGCVAAEFGQLFEITNGPPNGFGLLLVGGSEVAFPFVGGFLLVAPMPLLEFPHALSGAGAYTMPFTTNASFQNRSLFMQVGYLDAGAPQNVTLSSAVEFRFR